MKSMITILSILFISTSLTANAKAILETAKIEGLETSTGRFVAIEDAAKDEETSAAVKIDGTKTEIKNSSAVSSIYFRGGEIKSLLGLQGGGGARMMTESFGCHAGGG